MRTAVLGGWDTGGPEIQEDRRSRGREIQGDWRSKELRYRRLEIQEDWRSRRTRDPGGLEILGDSRPRGT